jgi:hypothetical protein
MIDLAGYSLTPDKACIVCGHVMDGAPVLAVAHDDDGDLQFACGEEAHTTADWHVVGLEHIDLRQLGLGDMPIVDAGFAALREDLGSTWEIVSVG